MTDARRMVYTTGSVLLVIAFVFGCLVGFDHFTGGPDARAAAEHAATASELAATAASASKASLRRSVCVTSYSSPAQAAGWRLEADIGQLVVYGAAHPGSAVAPPHLLRSVADDTDVLIQSATLYATVNARCPARGHLQPLTHVIRPRVTTGDP